MTYVFCKRIIENRTYDTKEDFQMKLDVFFMGGRINDDQYNELTTMLAAA